MEESKLELNYQREIGYGLLFGCYQLTMNMVNGQLVEKLISWKAEEMLDILNNSEEDLKLLVLLYTGEVIILLTNT
jgi:hypothetical protein